ncbi:MAG: hypothetical protein K5840_02045 [Eubacterium sp.]|nr:hypothetical protein [Eubacterium sp.]
MNDKTFGSIPVEEYYEKSYRIRKRFIEIFSKLGFGHLTTAFSETEIMIALFEGVMRFDENRKPIDKFVLSKGHGAGMIYPILEDMGIFTSAEIEDMVRIGGDITTIRDYVYPGFEFYGGSLGIGIGMAAGLALGLKQNRQDSMVYCLCGDAECYEGSVWEAMLFAAHNRLNNLVVIVDRNFLGVSDFTENMCGLEPFSDKWLSCNWDVVEVDGHSYEELLEVLSDTHRRKSSAPLCIVADTVKGKGIDDISNIPLKHGYMPKAGDAEEAIRKLEHL